MWTEFQNPGAEWRAKPFWSWNGELKKDELIRQIHVMKEMGFGGFFMHSRSGLATEYLGEEWFELINACADEAEKLGMEAWLYDEDRWPSGCAGGMVTVDPQHRMKSLWLTESDEPLPAERCLARFAVTLENGKLASYRRLEGSLMPGERAACFAIESMPCSSNYNGTTYIDTMSRAAVDRFIELTHEAYARHCGARLGRSIKGIFTDEPYRGNMMADRREKDGVVRCSAPWTGDLPQEFEARKGYELMARLPELFYASKGEDLSAITRDFFDVTDDLFVERFAQPINEWCEKHNIIFTGHVLHEDSLTNQSVPHGSLMRFYEHMGYPGMDLLGEDNECYWAATQLNSACRQTGKRWLLSEMYGGSGWQFDLQSHKALGDWQALLGINLRCPHLSWYTMEGEAKRDYPASILHQSPWYPDYKQVEDYFARFGMLMAQGQPDCDVLVVSPIESVWSMAHAGWAEWIMPVDDRVKQLEAAYSQTYHALADAGIDFDYGEEAMMARLGQAEENGIRVGQMRYRVAVVSGALTIRKTTAALLKAMMAQGGHVVFVGNIPENAREIAAHSNAIFCEMDQLAQAVRSFTQEPAVISPHAGKPVLVKSRCLEDGSRVVFILNTDKKRKTEEITLRIAGRYACAQRIDLETGKRYMARRGVDIEEAECGLRLSLLGGECRVYRLCLEAEEALPEEKAYEKAWERPIQGEMTYQLLEDNVCVLDRCDWRWRSRGEAAHSPSPERSGLSADDMERRGEVWHGMQDVLRADGQIRDEAGLERRGGAMLQPWFAKKFDDPSFGKLELKYEFFVESMPESVCLAAERPDRCRYFLNGVALTCPNENDFWIDICFKKLPIPTEALRLGRNEITVETTFTRTSNVEAVYLLGNFGVELEGVKQTLVSLPERLRFGSLTEQRLPFYTGPVTLDVPLSGGDAEKICLRAENFTGAAIRVNDGSDEPQTMKWEPWEADVTCGARSGAMARVTLVPTRRDTFGPLHVRPVRFGPCGPMHFTLTDSSWTDEYALLENGVEKLSLVGYR